MALITPEFLQTRTYPAIRDRLAFQHGGNLQAGVWDASDFKVTQRAAGANMSVDIAAGFALVAASNAGNAGLYHVQNDAAINSATAGITWTASNGSFPRLDQLFVEINDSWDGADASDVPVFRVVTGTAQAGVTLDNRTGAGAAPANALRIADILIPAGASTITTANIRDRRPWIRGANWYYIRTSTSYTTTLTTFAAIDATNILPRIETSGFPIKITMLGRAVNTGGGILFTPVVDGVAVAAGTNDAYSVPQDGSSVGGPPPTMLVHPAAGSHTFGIHWRVTGGTGTLVSAAQTPFAVLIEEIIRPVASNS